jgi:hypothetical protein
MLKVPKGCYEFPIYTNCEVDDIDIEDGDGDDMMMVKMLMKTHPYA